ncbi:hypothetical protein F3N42_00395 [Marinihelvus fidelis]|uniref:Biopolymer transporter TolR n=1 Tax=Marinihelvus fidelis TaxID=2613842 RepID=A0A5N0TG37_9GAMM|nr:TolB family protein [Marinihelvus fidelis]KAA9134045.1 hypothetical protein F3N42_00395 [Marinihelvus fidelis]
MAKSGIRTFALATLPFAGLLAAHAEVGQFDSSQDIGDVGHTGSAVFDADAGSYRVTASGRNLWGDRDGFHFVWKKIPAQDLSLAADIAFVGEGADPHRKAGLMIRQSLDDDAAYVDVILHGDGLTSMQWRDGQGSETHQITWNETHAERLKIERIDDAVYWSLARQGEPLARAGGNARLDLGPEVYVGLALSAHNNTVTETAVFSDVVFEAIDFTPPPDPGYGAEVDSTLEVIDIRDGNRRVVHHLAGTKFEAPNWSADDQLIYNQGGLIYRIPVAGGTPQVINTGPLNRNNNDHGISPDGTRLIISDQSEPDDLSRIYILPITGSDNPELVVGHPTDRSYWHAWHPDGDLVGYTARRPEVSDVYDIWAKRLSGGDEFRLVGSDGLDDGAEFTPDGQWVYFNSSRSGQMKIWRARADGSAPEKVTFGDDTRDWFPHFSPDGRWMVYIAFYTDIDVNDHPPNRRVELRIAPTDGSEPPRTLTKLFGGQGTINVPSWSPDSTRVAFVSYRFAAEQVD